MDCAPPARGLPVLSPRISLEHLSHALQLRGERAGVRGSSARQRRDLLLPSATARAGERRGEVQQRAPTLGLLPLTLTLSPQAGRGDRALHRGLPVL